MLKKVEGSTKKIENAYSTLLFKIWNTTMMPKLMMLELYKSDVKLFDTKHLMVDDIIYFKKDESVLVFEWTVGRITDVIIGNYGAARNASLRFQNVSKK